MHTVESTESTIRPILRYGAYEYEYNGIVRRGATYTDVAFVLQKETITVPLGREQNWESRHESMFPIHGGRAFVIDHTHHSQNYRLTGYLRRYIDDIFDRNKADLTDPLLISIASIIYSQLKALDLKGYRQENVNIATVHYQIMPSYTSVRFHLGVDQLRDATLKENDRWVEHTIYKLCLDLVFRSIRDARNQAPDMLPLGSDDASRFLDSVRGGGNGLNARVSHIFRTVLAMEVNEGAKDFDTKCSHCLPLLDKKESSLIIPCENTVQFHLGDVSYQLATNRPFRTFERMSTPVEPENRPWQMQICKLVDDILKEEKRDKPKDNVLTTLVKTVSKAMHSTPRR